MEDTKRLLRLAVVAGLLLGGMITVLSNGTSLPAGGAGAVARAGNPSGAGSWSTAAPMPIYRSEMSAAVLNGKIYVAGGLAGSSPQYEATTDAFQAYDPATNTWAEAPRMPDNLHHLGIASLDGSIYVTGGYDDSDFNVDVSATWVFSSATQTWTQAADMPGPRAAHASVGIGGLLYVVGGVGFNPTALWVYNPATNTWDASRAPLPTAREHLTAAQVDGKLYVIAGRWFGSGNLGTVEVYDPATNTWASRAGLPTPRSGLTSAVLAGRIHVTGGEDLGSLDTYYQHEVYDPATNTWATFPRMPTARHGLASGAATGKWYVIGGGLQASGGTYSTLSNLVEVFTPGSAPWPTLTPTVPATTTPTRTISPTRTATSIAPPTATATPTTTPCALTFEDVPESNPFHPYIRCLACRNILGGYADRTFRPNNNITRGQLSKIVSNAAGYSETPSSQTFQDVHPGSAFYPYIERMALHEVISGYDCGGPGEPCVAPSNLPYFRPDNNATRGQMSKIVSNAAGLTGPPGAQRFQDVPPDSPFFEWVQRLAAQGVISGYDCGSPGEACIPPGNLPYFRPATRQPEARPAR
jgi:N-acetylneuraminic acid mutarotase